MIISVSHVEKSRKLHECSICYKFIHAGSRLIDMYGMAEVGDKPYHIHFHVDCFTSSPSKDAVKHMKNCDICKAMKGSAQ